MLNDAEAAHMTDKLETDLGEFRRVNNRNKTLLKEALDALEKGKTHVVKDHLERILDDLDQLKDL